MQTRYYVNLTANFLGSSWMAILQLAAIPFYIDTVGIEAYGLIGFFTTLLITSRAFDLGLTNTINRELARLSAQPDEALRAKSFVRTIEVIYWPISLSLGGAIWLGSSALARHWLNAGNLSESDVSGATSLMGVVIALQMLVAFYHGGLMGLQRQVVANLIRATMGTISVVGGVLCLYLISAEIRIFFIWHAAVSVAHVAIITLALWGQLPPAETKVRFSFSEINRNLPFAAGMGGIGISALVLSQLDRLILSKLLSLEMFGYYVLGYTFGSALYLIIIPVFNATLPRLSALVAQRNPANLRQAYRAGVRLMATLVLPSSAVLVVFAEPLLRAWTGRPEAAHFAAPIAAMIAAGTALNGLMHLPFALQIAYGWTSIGLTINLLFIAIMLPALIFAVEQSGALGAATVWLGLNALYMLLGVPLTHQKILRGETFLWFVRGALLPIAIASLIVLVASTAPYREYNSVQLVAFCLFTILAGVLTASLCSAETRRWLSIRLKLGFGFRRIS